MIIGTTFTCIIMILYAKYCIHDNIDTEKIKEHTEIKLGYQYGFRVVRSTIDAIHILNQIMEKSYEWSIQHLPFIDFKQAFGNLKRDIITT